MATELRYYDRQGESISLMEWAALAENLTYRTVARTQVKDDVLVSTIWLGMPDIYNTASELFETMVFGGEHGSVEERHATEAMAVARHEHWVEVVTQASEE